jgi:hypothetical protein
MSWHFTNDSTTNTFLTRKKSSTTFALESHEFYEPSDCDLIYL